MRVWFEIGNVSANGLPTISCHPYKHNPGMFQAYEKCRTVLGILMLMFHMDGRIRNL